MCDWLLVRLGFFYRRYQRMDTDERGWDFICVYLRLSAVLKKWSKIVRSLIAYFMRFATRLELSPWWNLILPSTEFLSFNFSQPLPDAGSHSSLPSHVNSNR